MDWKKRQKHHEAFQQAFDAAGCKYFPNTKVVMTWNGKRFAEVFEPLGHTAVEFDRCECGKVKV